MRSTGHVILKQFLDVEHDADVNPKVLGDRLSELFRGRLAAAIERVMDEFDHPDQLIRLDKIEIELDCGDLDELEELLLARLPLEMEAALREAVLDPDRTEIVPTGKSVFDSVVFYLEKGYLPWNVRSGITLPELEFRLTEALDNVPGLTQSLIRLLLEDHLKLTRFIHCFSMSLIWRLADFLQPGIRDAWESLERPPEIKRLDPVVFWQTFYRELLTAEKTPESTASRIRKALRKKRPAKKADAEKKTKKREKPEALAEETPEEGIFIGNAGVVILHPFLEVLFDELKATRGGVLEQPAKAVQILNYAVAGRQTAEEWDLPLLKILCGIPLPEVIRWDDELSAAETAEIDKMLSAVIKYWEILKNTGIDGLQEAFLQREGQIHKGKSNWTLRVEQKGTDILLDHLPWSIGYIKLPWMELPLVVEWN